MICVVTDTNVLIASTFWSGDPCKILLSVLDNKIEIRTSKEILSEVRKILREEFEISEQENDDIVNCIVSYTKIVEPKIRVNIVRDPKDNIVLECALEAKAKYIITRDKDLLEISEYEGIKIVKPEEFLELEK